MRVALMAHFRVRRCYSPHRLLHHHSHIHSRRRRPCANQTLRKPIGSKFRLHRVNANCLEPCDFVVTAVNATRQMASCTSVTNLTNVIQKQQLQNLSHGTETLVLKPTGNRSKHLIRNHPKQALSQCQSLMVSQQENISIYKHHTEDGSKCRCQLA